MERYGIGITCNTQLRDVRLTHYSSYWLTRLSSDFGSARRSESISENMENNIDSSISTNVLRWHRIGRIKQLNAKSWQS